MEEALDLQYYLPLSYKSKSEQEYIAFLWDTFETNYTFEKYQFALLAYHMLTMSLVMSRINCNTVLRQGFPREFDSRGVDEDVR